MASGLIFGSKDFEDTVLCDYRQYHNCRWIESTPNKLSRYCPRPRKFSNADERLQKEESDKRVEIAKRIRIYDELDGTWEFSINQAKDLSGEELAGIIEVVDSWREKNTFQLTDLVKYRKRGWF